VKKRNTAQSGVFSLRLILCAAAVCSIITGTLLAFFRSDSPANASQRTLTFAERVAYQRAIEEVYWRHRIWPRERSDPKPSFDAVMSQAQLERKVHDYLRASQALQDYWQQPITSEQLQAEINRMATHTQQPEVLCEIFEGLGNDPFVIAECLARPALAHCLVTALDNEDRLQLTTIAWLRDPLRSGITTAEREPPQKVAAIDSIAKAVEMSRPYQLPAIAKRSSGCTDDTWTPRASPMCPLAEPITRQYGPAVK